MFEHDHEHDEDCGCPSGEFIRADCAAKIAEYGWYCVATKTANGTPYAYTVGVSATYHHPELVVVGLEAQIAHALLTKAVAIIHGGAWLSEGHDREDIIQGFPARFRALDQGSCFVSFAVADTFYGHSEIPRLQLLFPDASTRFPGEAECDVDISAAQDIGG
jgi:hypothetical protein